MIYALIPAYDHWDKVTKCVRALNERARYENLRTLVYYQHDHGAPAGFTKATNKLFQYAIVDPDLDGVFIINDDTEVATDNWVLKTLDFVRSDPAIGVVSLQELLPPRFNYSLLPYSRQRCPRGEGEPTDLNYCGFGFCYITAECLRSVGLLDENFSPGYYEDYDFGVRAWLKGFKCKWYPAAQFKHEGGATFTSLVKKGIVTNPMERQAVYFDQKWTFLRHDMPPEEAVRILKEKVGF